MIALALASMALVFGHSAQDRPLVAREQGDAGAGRTVLVVGSIHGNETEGHRVVRRLRRHYDHLDGVDLWTVMTVNPDGVAAHTRGNAHSVDLNRNFSTNWKPIPPSSGYYSGPKPFSEPETKAVRGLLRRIRPDVTVWYHQPFGHTLIPCNRRGRRVALRYARLSGLPADDCFPTPPGAATGWQDAKLHEKAFVVEFPAGRLSRGEVRRHAAAVAEIAAPG
ncbi:MAG: murein peptide amidase [Solirubrobacterales bacterium]|nr:murein peptide amidase [Solirubrobacterales bacterium]